MKVSLVSPLGSLSPLYRGAFAVNSVLDAAMPAMMPLGVVIGFAAAPVLRPLKPLVTYLFAFVTLVGAMGLTVGDFKKAVQKPAVLAAVFLVSHVVVPVVTAGAAKLAFPGQPDLVSGYVLLMSIPVAVSCYLWSSIYHGLDAVVLTVLLLDTVVAPLVTPLSVTLLAHTEVAIDTTGMMLSLLWMVVVPMVVGVALNQGTKNGAKAKAVPLGKPFSKLFLMAVVSINSAQVVESVVWSWALVPVVGVSALTSFFGFAAGWAAAKWAFRGAQDLQVTMCFTCGMRNISASLVLAIQYFPPAAAVPVIVGILLQQTMAAVSGRLFFSSKTAAKVPIR
jgi:tagaturonate reductase